MFKLIGTIGALDPYLIKKIMNKYFGGAGEDEEDLTLVSLLKLEQRENKDLKGQKAIMSDSQFSTRIDLKKELERHKQK